MRRKWMKPISFTATTAGLLIALPLYSAAWAADASSPAHAAANGSVNRDLGKGPASQTSVSPPPQKPTTTKHTGASDQSSKVKSMNQEAKQKVETEGK